MNDKNIDKWLGLFFGTVLIIAGSRWLGEALGVPDTYGFAAGIMMLCVGQKWLRGGDE